MNVQLNEFTITGFEPKPVRITDDGFVALCDRVATGTATDADRAELAVMLQGNEAAAI
jgi:hypothetical protein